MPAAVLLDSTRLDRPDTLVRRDPFAFLIAHGQLPEQARGELDRDFPKYSGAGFFPYKEKECGDAIRALVDALTSPAFADAVGAKLGIDNLGQYPTLVTICRHLNKRHGTIHTDSKSKIATALLYLNASWPDTSDGCLRFLAKVDDIDAAVAPEVKPLYGEFVIFRRCRQFLPWPLAIRGRAPGHPGGLADQRRGKAAQDPAWRRHALFQEDRRRARQALRRGPRPQRLASGLIPAPSAAVALFPTQRIVFLPGAGLLAGTCGLHGASVVCDARHTFQGQVRTNPWHQPLEFSEGL